MKRIIESTSNEKQCLPPLADWFSWTFGSKQLFSSTIFNQNQTLASDPISTKMIMSTLLPINHDKHQRIIIEPTLKRASDENFHQNFKDNGNNHTIIDHHYHLPALSLSTLSSPLSSQMQLYRTASNNLNNGNCWPRNCTIQPTLSALFFITLLLILITQGCFGIEVVSLNVPSHVRKGSDLELSCQFDLGNATLYSLKWFYRAHEWDREEQEFFRYTPRHKPYKQVFPLEGIHVDLSKSSGSMVYIRGANSKTSGKYKCEISVEETFQTVAAEKLMTVFNSSHSSMATRPNNILMYFSTLFTMLIIIDVFIC